MGMSRGQRLELLKQIEKDIYVPSIESTLLEEAKSCAIHSVIAELEQEPTTQERQAESDKFDATFQDGYNNGYRNGVIVGRQDIHDIAKKMEIPMDINKGQREYDMLYFGNGGKT